MSDQPDHQASASVIGARELRAALATHLDRVEAGATVVIKRGGRPVARLVPLSEPTVIERGLEEMARLGLIEEPQTELRPVATTDGGREGTRPLPVDVRVDRIIRQVRG